MRFFYVVLLIFATACSGPDLDPIEKTTLSAHPAMLQVWHDPNAYEVQILFTEIERDSVGKAVFTDHSFAVNDSVYFYPASTVKLPAAVLALEYLSKQEALTPTTPYKMAGDSISYTLASDVAEIFAVSDNDAYNRIYEWLGRDYMNEQLRSKGMNVRLAHRLSTENSTRSQRDSVIFTSEQGDTIFTGTDAPISSLSTLRNSKKGKAYMRDGNRVAAPMDFSEKNYLPLKSLHDLTKRLFFPEAFTIEERFQLSEAHKKLLFENMKTVPRKLGYEEASYPDGYGKFFIYGDTQERIPETMHIYNKVGYAYGTLTETAYVHDTERNIEFILSATILVNKNQIFNDDTYEFDTVGIPFLAQLGREMYLHMLQK